MSHILLIEDETDLREEVLNWLILEDYEAAGAVEGMDGMMQAFQRRPDLIISDIAMPRLNGYDVTRTACPSQHGEHPLHFPERPLCP